MPECDRGNDRRMREVVEPRRNFIQNDLWNSRWSRAGYCAGLLVQAFHFLARSSAGREVTPLGAVMQIERLPPDA